MPALTTVESIGSTARLGVMRLGASRLGGKVTVDNLDKDLDGTYGWKRLDTTVRLARPETQAARSGWSTTRGSL